MLHRFLLTCARATGSSPTRAHRHGALRRAALGVACAMASGCVDSIPTESVTRVPNPISADIGNIAPTTSFAVAPRYPAPGDTVTVDGSYSHDPDGEVIRYRWSFGNGAVQNTSAKARTVFRTAGTFNVTLTTFDDRGDSASVTLALVVGSAGTPATAVSGATSTLSLSTSSATAGTAVTATVIARSATNAVLSGVPVAVGATGRSVSVAPAATTTNGSGVASATLASTVAQSTTIRAVADFTALTSTSALTVTPSLVGASRSSLRITKASLTSVLDSTIVEVTVRDTAGNPLSGATVSLGSSVAGLTLPASGVSDANGRWKGTVRGGTMCAGNSTTLTATASGTAITPTAALTSSAPSVYGVCAPNFWLDGSDASTLTTESGARVTEWRDKSGAAQHVRAPSGTAQRPTVTPSIIGNRAAITFAPASAQYLSTAAGVDARTMIAVMRVGTEGASNRTILSVQSSGVSAGCPDCEAFYLKSNDGGGGQSLLFLASTVNAGAVYRPRPAAVGHLLSSVTTSSAFDVAVDRGAAASGGYSGTLLPRDGATTVGAAVYGGNLVDFYFGELGELVTFNRVLSATERTAVEQGLMAKWLIGTIAISAGNGQSASAGTSPTTAPQVRITDASGGGLPGASVTFQVTGGGGRVSGGTALTVTSDAAGYASVPAGQWILDAGTNTLTAWYSGSAGVGSSVVLTATGTLPTGLALRLDASDTTSLLQSSACTGTIATNTQSVGCWLDRSGTGAHASQPISTDRPVVNATGIGGRRTIGFTLSRENWLGVTNATIRNLRGTASSLFTVATTGSTENNVDNASSALAVWQGWHNGLTVYGNPSTYLLIHERWARADGGASVFPDACCVVPGVPFVASALTTFTSATNFTASAFVNGTGGAASSTSDPTPGGASDFHIGQGNVAPQTSYRYRLDGRIGEVILFNRALTNAERLQVERYLGWKWGVSVQ
jgi:PKD domain/Bacterial Ig-like domain (group 1)